MAVAITSRAREFDLNRLTARLAFNATRRANFYADLAAFDAAGHAPFRALEKMRSVGRRRRSLRWLMTILDSALRSAARGGSVAESLRPWIPGEEAAMLVAGENGGNLRGALNELATLLAAKIAVGASLRKNLIAAALSFAGLVALMIYILKTVMVQARPLVPDATLAKMSIAPLYFQLGELLMAWLIPLLVLAAIAAGAVIWSLAHWAPDPLRRKLDAHVPPWSLYGRLQAAFFLVTAASMMSAGQPFRVAVEEIRRFAAPWTRSHLNATLRRLAAGQGEVASMLTGMLPWDVEDRLLIYADLPDFRHVMQMSARDSMASLLAKVNFIGGAVKTVAMAMMAVFILFTVAAIGEIALEGQSNMNNNSSSM